MNVETIKLHPAVFYRKSDDYVVLYYTAKQKIYKLNKSAFNILDFFKEVRTKNDFISYLKEECGVKIDDVDTIKQYECFVDDLIEKGILIKSGSVSIKEETLEAEYSRIADEKHNLTNVTIELTYNCNETCRHCYVSKKQLPEMDFEKICSLMDEMSEMGVLSVTFTGGEAFSRHDILDILKYAYKKRFVVDIFSNGNLIKDSDLFELKAIWPRYMHFSLYSDKPELHDAITKVPGSFEKTVDVIKKCRLLGIPVNIKSPIFNETYESIDGLVSLSKSLGTTIEIGTNITPKKNGDIDPLSLKLDDDKRAAVEEKISELTEINDVIPENLELSPKLCGAGEHSLSINPYGEVFPCNMLALPLGNLYEHSLREIWENSNALKDWRKKNDYHMKEDCENCEYLQSCDFCPGVAMMFTGSPFRKYHDACVNTKIHVLRKENKHE